MLELGEITRDYGFEQRQASIEKNCGKFKIIMCMIIIDSLCLIIVDLIS